MVWFNCRNGEDWWRMRSEFQKGLSSPKAVRCMLPDSEQIVREWIRHLNVPASSFVPLDMLPELSRLNLERTFYCPIIYVCCIVQTYCIHSTSGQPSSLWCSLKWIHGWRTTAHLNDFSTDGSCRDHKQLYSSHRQWSATMAILWNTGLPQIERGTRIHGKVSQLNIQNCV